MFSVIQFFMNVSSCYAIFHIGFGVFFLLLWSCCFEFSLSDCLIWMSFRTLITWFPLHISHSPTHSHFVDFVWVLTNTFLTIIVFSNSLKNRNIASIPYGLRCICSLCASSSLVSFEMQLPVAMQNAVINAKTFPCTIALFRCDTTNRPFPIHYPLLLYCRSILQNVSNICKVYCFQYHCRIEMTMKICL